MDTSCSSTSVNIEPVHQLSVAKRMLRALSAMWCGHITWQAKRATIAVLHELDERTLKDIGLDRSEIESVVLGATGERLRTYDDKWWRTRSVGRSGNTM